MAYRTHTPELGLLITIHPRACTRYYGTAEQLVDEGLIPKGFKWPTGTARISYVIGKFSFWLGRCRPDGLKGPMSLWANGDYWSLQRSLTSQEGDGWTAALIYEKTRELASILKCGTPEWQRTCEKAWAARQDPNYAAFIENLTAKVTAKRGRGRPAKSTQTPVTSQGASA